MFREKEEKEGPKLSRKTIQGEGKKILVLKGKAYIYAVLSILLAPILSPPSLTTNTESALPCFIARRRLQFCLHKNNQKMNSNGRNHAQKLRGTKHDLLFF